MLTDSFKDAARAKSDEVLRKDTTDESDISSFFSIQTRDQKLNKMYHKRKAVSSTTDLNNLAIKCMKNDNESVQDSSAINNTPESVGKIAKYVRESGLSNNLENNEHDVDQYYKQFLNEDYDDNDIYNQNTKTEYFPGKRHDSPQPTNLEAPKASFGEAGSSNLAALNEPRSKVDNLITLEPSDQILTMTCSGSVQNSEMLEEIRKIVLSHDQILKEIRALLTASQSHGKQVEAKLQSIKEDTCATLSNFVPDENLLASMVPGFQLPINDVEVLECFDEQLGKDESFKSIVVRPPLNFKNCCIFP